LFACDLLPLAILLDNEDGLDSLSSERQYGRSLENGYFRNIAFEAIEGLKKAKSGISFEELHAMANAFRRLASTLIT
jgi:hypothetical protein